MNNANWPQLPIAYEIHSYGVVNTLLHTFSPTLVAEVTVGLNHGKQTVEPLTQADLERNDRTNVGLSSLPQFFPEANPARILPNASFGVAGLALGSSISQIASLGVEGRYPFFGQNDIWNTSANLTKVMGAHNMKVGLFYEHTTRPAARSSTFNGSFNFDRNTSNPLDTNHPYANALIGSVNSYSEATQHPDADARFTNIEWFVQDNWRVKKNFTVDAGVRFYRIGPTTSRGDQLAVFLPDQFNASQAPLLIQPISTPNGRRGVNPVTGEILPAVKIGTFAPNSGNTANGVQVFDEGVLDTPSIQVAPRIGFSWDVTGNGKTAVRGGFGVFPDRFNDDIILQFVELPPIVNTPTANYTTIKELLSTPLSLSPATARSINPNYKPQHTYNYSVGVQRDLGWKLLADVAYVGSKGRRLLQTRNINGVPYGDELPSVQRGPDDRRAASRRFPATLSRLRRHPPQRVRRLLGLRRVADGHQSALLARAPVRPVVHPLEGQERRRHDGNGQSDRQPVPRHPRAQLRRRRPAAQPDHQLRVRRAWAEREMGHRCRARHLRQLADLRECTSALSGATLPLTYSISGVSDLTGGAGAGADSRVDIICDPNLSRGDRIANPGVPNRVHRAALTVDEPGRHGRRRRDHRARVSELGHHVREARAVRWEPPVHVPMRALQRVQQCSVLEREHRRDLQRRRCSRQTRSSGIHRRARCTENSVDLQGRLLRGR